MLHSACTWPLAASRKSRVHWLSGAIDMTSAFDTPAARSRSTYQHAVSAGDMSGSTSPRRPNRRCLSASLKRGGGSSIASTQLAHQPHREQMGVCVDDLARRRPRRRVERRGRRQGAFGHVVVSSMRAVPAAPVPRQRLFGHEQGRDDVGDDERAEPGDRQDDEDDAQDDRVDAQIRTEPAEHAGDPPVAARPEQPCARGRSVCALASHDESDADGDERERPRRSCRSGRTRTTG